MVSDSPFGCHRSRSRQSFEGISGLQKISKEKQTISKKSRCQDSTTNGRCRNENRACSSQTQPRSSFEDIGFICRCFIQGCDSDSLINRVYFDKRFNCSSKAVHFEINAYRSVWSVSWVSLIKSVTCCVFWWVDHTIPLFSRSISIWRSRSCSWSTNDRNKSETIFSLKLPLSDWYLFKYWNALFLNSWWILWFYVGIEIPDRVRMRFLPAEVGFAHHYFGCR